VNGFAYGDPGVAATPMDLEVGRVPNLQGREPAIAKECRPREAGRVCHRGVPSMRAGGTVMGRRAGRAAAAARDAYHTGWRCRARGAGRATLPLWSVVRAGTANSLR